MNLKLKVSLFLGLLYSVLYWPIMAQNYCKITGGNVNIVGNTNLILNNVQFLNSGSFSAGTGTVGISGSATDVQSAIGGDSTTIFYNLQINKTTNGSQLQAAIQVSNQLQMTSGNMDLNGHNITLGSSSGTIITESESSRITGTVGGFIIKTITLNAPTNVNPGNMGMVCSSNINIGALTIRRGHIPQSIGGSQGIARFFEFTHANNVDLNLTVEFQYFDAELNGNTEADLGFWRQDNTFWFNPEKNSSNTANNVVSVDNINLLTKWTLGPAAPKLGLKVLLEGPYSATNAEMNDDLRTGSLVPTAEPYTAMGYTHGSIGGGESIHPFMLSTTTNDAPVDWIIVELRNNANTVVGARSALLQRDGDIVDLDGHSPLSFPGIAPGGSYYVAIRHRNHLGIRSLNTVALSQTSTSIDFTIGTSLVIGGVNALKSLSPGIYGLFCGDFNGNGQIQSTDVDGIIPTIGTAGYLMGDMSMNGQVQNEDLQQKLTPNVGRAAQFTY